MNINYENMIYRFFNFSKFEIKNVKKKFLMMIFRILLIET